MIPCGPSLAALLMTSLTGGRQSVRLAGFPALEQSLKDDHELGLAS